MAIAKKLINYLVDNKYKYEIIPHRTTYTAWDTAQTEKVKPQEVAKSLVLKAGSDYLLAVISSSRNLDKKKFLKTLNAERKRKGEKNIKKIELAKENWMKKNIFGKVGATPPFAGFLKKVVFMDKLILKNKKIYLGSGEYDAALRISASQYLKTEKPAMGNFSAKKQ